MKYFFPRELAGSLAALAAVGVLSGCSSSSELLEGKKIDYRSEQKVAPLEVPPDLISPAKEDRFVVPTTSGKGGATFSAYVAERNAPKEASQREVLVEPKAGMRIERAGTQRWLVVEGTPDAIWPKLRDFWLTMGFSLAVDRPDIGVLETNWAENRAKIPQDFIRNTLGKLVDSLYSTPERDKFRMRIEPGKRPGEIEVYISHRGMQEIYPTEAKDRTIWQPRPPDPDLEAEMLRRLMVYLGVKEEQAQQMLVQAQPNQRARLETDGNLARLVVEDNFDRAWRRTGLALDRIGFTVEDRDPADGIYVVRYLDPDADTGESQGWFSRLAFWKGSDKPQQNSQYRVRVRGQGDTAVVQVLTPDSQPDTSKTAKQILELLYEELK